MRRAGVIAGLIVLMAAFGLGVNRYLAGSTRVEQINESAVRPPTELPTDVDVPGTVYVVQRGRLFRLESRHFTALDRASSGDWLQPASANDGDHLVAVLRGDESADLDLLDRDGHIVRRLTRNGSRTVEDNHWVFWPRVSADGGTVFTSYDQPKHLNAQFEVDLSVWSGSLEGNIFTHRWSRPNPFTGGDVHPAPLAGGGVLYAEYAIDHGKVFSQIVLKRSLTADPVQLTAATDDCSQPAVSPDGTAIAMVCSQGKQTTRLVIGHLNGHRLEGLHVLAQDCLCASPAWAPDGSGLAYLAPADATGHFQMWWVPGAAGTAAGAPQRVTNNLDLDATSAPAWLTGPPSTSSNSSAAPSPDTGSSPGPG